MHWYCLQLVHFRLAAVCSTVNSAANRMVVMTWMLLDGECQVDMVGRTVLMQTGDELLIPAGTRHTVRNCGDRPARWLHGYRADSAAS